MHFSRRDMLKVATLTALGGAGLAVPLLGHGNDATATAPTAGRTRTYYIAAEDLIWDYAPQGRNVVEGKPFDDTANVFVKRGAHRIGSRYHKALYVEYTDATFKTRLSRPEEDRYLGFQGPVIRAEVGDRIVVHFKNRVSFPTGIHPHGVFYDKGGEGAGYSDGSSAREHGDDAVPPGGSYTYTWDVPDRAGPAAMDGSSVMWMYHGHTDEIADTYAGLMGPLVVTARGKAKTDGSPKDVDREIFVAYTVMNENGSHYLERNARQFGGFRPPGEGDPDGEAFEESNLMHNINGYVFGNGSLITMHKGERVRWYLMAMGTEVDLHTPHWHGNTVTALGMRTDVVNLLPASMVVADMVPDNAGTWLFHCHVDDHIAAGMITRYRVLG
jgi:FtsP/CotA-like multicopper oxidase with cupredoxin domain